MKKIEAIIREEQFEMMKKKLQEIGVNGVTITQVMGFGMQKGWTEVVRGSVVEVNLLPKIKLEIVVSTDEWAEKTINAIKEVAFTDNPGDGKIFVWTIEEAIRIHTGETGAAALN